MVVIATDINAFHVIGALLGVWALVLAGLGVMRHDFPPKGAEKIVIAISALLMVSAVGSAIATGGEAKPKGGEQAGAKAEGGTPAPGTGSSAGQQSGGNAQPKPGQATTQTLTLSADPSGALRFDKTALQATKGTVRIVLNNPAPVEHNISIQGPGGVNKQGPTVQKGGASQVSVPVAAGKYTYYCSVPGHRQAGMQGTLTVK